LVFDQWDLLWGPQHLGIKRNVQKFVGKDTFILICLSGSNEKWWTRALHDWSLVLIWFFVETHKLCTYVSTFCIPLYTLCCSRPCAVLQLLIIYLYIYYTNTSLIRIFIHDLPTMLCKMMYFFPFLWHVIVLHSSISSTIYGDPKNYQSYYALPRGIWKQKE
jgi:hypothetical protein